ncbi:MAG: hypothetical protein ACLP59_12750 [Bryobacteraceae bacterium]
MHLRFTPILLWAASYCLVAQTVPHPASPRAINGGGIVNAASYTAPVAPGSIATAFGTFAVSTTTGATTVPLTTSLGGLSLQDASGAKVPLFFVSSTQVNFQVPWELAGQSTTTLADTANGQTGTAQTVSLATFAPAIFSLDTTGSGPGAVLDSSYQLVNSTNPAVSGSTYILIYCTGLGPVNATVATGAPAPSNPPASTTTAATVTIGGVQATPSFAGLAPGYVGLYQVNVQVPASVAAGSSVPVTISIGSLTSNTVTIPVTTPPPAFNIMTTNINSFTPGTATLTGLPTVTVTNSDGSQSQAPSVGYQDGAFLEDKAIYFPWQVSNGGTTWVEVIKNGIPQSVILSYDATSGVAGFNNPANWTWFDLSTLDWAGKGTVPNSPAAFQGGTVVGNIVYPAPNSGHPYAVFIAYDASQALNSPSAYQTFVPPPRGGALGDKYGWCSGTNDGRFIYYAPLSDPLVGNSGNILRYDTTGAFSDLSSWANFDLGENISPNAESFQSAVYDGNRYIYFIPFHKNLIVRYDTWGGGSSANPAAFTNPASYTLLDPTQLNSPGYPAASGLGNPANLLGFTGTAVAWDSAHQNEYLYLVPWATFPGNVTGGVGQGAQDPVLQSTAARVRIATQNGAAWTSVDITSTTTSSSTSPNWEIFDLNTLTQNQAWPATWGKVFPADAGAFAGQSAIAGWQIAYNVTTPFPMVGFVPDKSQYFVQHSVDHALADPSGWYVAQVPSGYHGGTMGGGYDATDQMLYPSAPGTPLFVIQFTVPGQ